MKMVGALEVPAFAGSDSYRMTIVLGERRRFQPPLESVQAKTPPRHVFY